MGLGGLVTGEIHEPPTVVGPIAGIFIDMLGG